MEGRFSLEFQASGADRRRRGPRGSSLVFGLTVSYSSTVSRLRRPVLSIRYFFVAGTASIVATLMLALCSWSCSVPPGPLDPGYTAVDHKPADPGLVPFGRFKDIHSIAVIEPEGLHDIRDRLEGATCFKLPQSSAEADATLRVEMSLKPPQGKVSYTLGEMIQVYEGRIVNRKGATLWRGSESTRQKMAVDPSLHVPPGTSFYKDVMPLDAELFLLLDLKDAACAMPTNSHASTKETK